MHLMYDSTASDFPNGVCRVCGDQVASPRIARLRATTGTSLDHPVRVLEDLVRLMRGDAYNTRYACVRTRMVGCLTK